MKPCDESSDRDPHANLQTGNDNDSEILTAAENYLMVHEAHGDGTESKLVTKKILLEMESGKLTCWTERQAKRPGCDERMMIELF